MARGVKGTLGGSLLAVLAAVAVVRLLMRQDAVVELLARAKAVSLAARVSVSAAPGGAHEVTTKVWNMESGTAHGVVVEVTQVVDGHRADTKHCVVPVVLPARPGSCHVVFPPVVGDVRYESVVQHEEGPVTAHGDGAAPMPLHRSRDLVSDPARREAALAAVHSLDVHLERGYAAFDAGDYAGAMGDYEAGRAALATVQARVDGMAPSLSARDHAGLAQVLLHYADLFDAAAADAHWFAVSEHAYADYDAATTAGQQADALTSLRLGLASAAKAEATLGRLATQAVTFRSIHPVLAADLGFDAAYVTSLHEWQEALRTDIADAEALVGAGQAQPFGHGDTYGIPESIVAPWLADHFASFDADGDGGLAVDEAADFYHWVEDTILYRYDDEAVRDPAPGTLVGDGVPGRHYQQTPNETVLAAAGDCEDMNTLEVAFYEYWGITAYQGLVNAESRGVDHAVALVLVGETMAEAQEIMGSRFHSYTIEEGNRHGMPAGVYAIVDNTYSDAFGFVSGGVAAGQFRLLDVRSLGEAFDVEIA